MTPKKPVNAATAGRPFRIELSPFYFLPRVAKTIKGEIGRFRIGASRFVLLTSPDHIRQAGRLEKQVLSRQAFNESVMAPILGEGVFSSSESGWLGHRRNAMGFLKPTHANVEKWRKAAASAALAALEITPRQVDALAFARIVASRALQASLFGDPEALDRQQLHRTVGRILAASEYAALIRMYFGRRIGGRLARPVQYFGRRAKDRMERLIDGATPAEDSPAGDPALRNDLKSLLFAGQDTPTLALAYLLWLLGLQPDLQERIRSELAQYGHESPLLQGAVMETLRLLPPLHTPSPRTALADLNINGVDIPRGTEVMDGIWHAHQRCPNSEDFDPARFDDPDNKTPFMPFCVGPKQCPGRYLAMTFMTVAATEVLHRRRIDSRDRRLRLKSMALLAPIHPVPIALADLE